MPWEETRPFVVTCKFAAVDCCFGVRRSSPPSSLKDVSLDRLKKYWHGFLSAAAHKFPSLRSAQSVVARTDLRNGSGAKWKLAGKDAMQQNAAGTADDAIDEKRKTVNANA